MQEEIAGPILDEVRQRLSFLDAVGLEYLTLDRLASTLSGGEAQRIQLATSLGSRLVGALYVLDEPSIGLHTRDTARLIHILEELRDLGNTILVVEHDRRRSARRRPPARPWPRRRRIWRQASGRRRPRRNRGQSQLAHRPLSFRQDLHSGADAPARARARNGWCCAEPRRTTCMASTSRFRSACWSPSPASPVRASPRWCTRCCIAPLLARWARPMAAIPPGVFKSLTGVERLNDVVLVDQTPIGRTPRSNPITYIKGFDLVRELFASQPEAKRLSLTPGHFSFNVPGGRCNTCEGDGTVTVEMQFLADVELPCEDCNGTRYQAKILEVQYKGKNIHEVLQMTVKEALRFFAGQTKLLEKLAVLDEIGLGYLRLGQSATTLSGGEAQRVKLAAHLAQVRAANANAKPSQASRVLYILDEPTTGLHFDDVSKLLTAFRKLIDGGGSLIVIEHNLDVIKSADWVIDLGPEGGEGGGSIVAEGTPEEIAGNLHSHTGKWLARVL